MAKPKFTFEEHVEMGRMLAAISDDLTQRSTKVGGAYPASSAPVKRLRAAVKALGEARSALDDVLFREQPEQAETTVYYPHAEDRPRITR
jgi:hypothetical protein